MDGLDDAGWNLARLGARRYVADRSAVMASAEERKLWLQFVERYADQHPDRDLDTIVAEVKGLVRALEAAEARLVSVQEDDARAYRVTIEAQAKKAGVQVGYNEYPCLMAAQLVNLLVARAEKAEAGIRSLFSAIGFGEDIMDTLSVLAAMVNVPFDSEKAVVVNKIANAIASAKLERENTEMFDAVTRARDAEAQAQRRAENYKGQELTLRDEVERLRGALDRGVWLMNSLLDVVFQTQIPDRDKLVAAGEAWVAKALSSPVPATKRELVNPMDPECSPLKRESPATKEGSGHR